MMSSFFSTDLGTRGLDGDFKISKFSDQSQEATGLKYTANLLTHFGQYDLPFSGLNFLSGFENHTQAVTGYMAKDRKIKDKPGDAFSYRTIEQFMQLVGSHFVDIATGSDNKYLTTDFSMYRHFLSIFYKNLKQQKYCIQTPMKVRESFT
jgi:hypothetical protein